MGTDIRIVLEERDLKTSEWKTIAEKESPALYHHRQYAVFACLADIRNRIHVRPLGRQIDFSSLSKETQKRLEDYREIIVAVTLADLDPKSNAAYWHRSIITNAYFPLGDIINFTLEPAEHVTVVKSAYESEYQEKIEEESWHLYNVIRRVTPSARRPSPRE